jgi:endo-1,4-beta-xylanase
MRSATKPALALVTASMIVACSGEATPPASRSAAGAPNKGGMSNGSGGSGGTPGSVNTSAGTGGSASGGYAPSGGSSFAGSHAGVGAGGSGGAGGKANGGGGMGGKAGGGTAGAAGASTGSAGGAPLDCNATMPTSGTKHSGNGQGGKDNLAWQLWANNAANGSITTFSTTAFEADWNNAGDFLARIGYEWGNAGKSYDTYGTISADFAYKKTGTGGGYSYIGIYGWSTNPCVEWYIVDDSYNGMPVNPGNTTNKGTVKIDGADYILYTRQTTGTGGSRCNGVSSWAQYYSIRKTARQCGTISITQHFDAWKAASMPLGNLLEAKILVEVGGGSGSVQFPVANVTLVK